ncbi:hypothetical protein BZA70DRAFT_55010 [Myxozyma melibiosi]|uniref:GATA-type domain-containing protein n=1 Tax=Myxozyma melibiosi TaxID=54550 RepID=A0ABR1FFH3_9ASCO
MSLIESSGLPSPNPSVDSCFAPPEDDNFDRAFQRILEDRCSNIYEQRAAKIVNPLPTPNSEACLSSDECEDASSSSSSSQLADHADCKAALAVSRARDEFPFPQVDLSLFYPDTAPRQSWRPQIETWIRRNHSYKFDRIASKPYTLPSPQRTKSASSTSSSSSSSSSSHKSHSHPKTPKVTSFSSASSSAAAHSTSHSSSHAQSLKKFDHDKSDADSGLISPSPSPKPSAATLHSSHSGRKCISCGSDQSPCWRPSWSVEAGQLCNSCGLRYKKTGARCLSSSCGRIPAKGEWVTMRSSQPSGRYSCLYCGGGVAVGENSKR